MRLGRFEIWALVEARFGLEDILFVNDFRALARFTPDLPASATIALNEATGGADGPMSVSRSDASSSGAENGSEMAFIP